MMNHEQLIIEDDTVKAVIETWNQAGKFIRTNAIAPDGYLDSPMMLDDITNENRSIDANNIIKLSSEKRNSIARVTCSIVGRHRFNNKYAVATAFFIGPTTLLTASHSVVELGKTIWA